MWLAAIIMAFLYLSRFVVRGEETLPFKNSHIYRAFLRNTEAKMCAIKNMHKTGNGGSE